MTPVPGRSSVHRCNRAGVAYGARSSKSGASARLNRPCQLSRRQSSYRRGRARGVSSPATSRHRPVGRRHPRSPAPRRMAAPSQPTDTTTCTVVANWRRPGVMAMKQRMLCLSRGPRHGRELCRGRFHDRLTALVLRPREHDLVAVNGDARVATGSCARYCRHGGDWRRAT